MVGSGSPTIWMSRHQYMANMLVFQINSTIYHDIV